MSTHSAPAKATVSSLQAMKRRGGRIVMLTAYDCPTARLEDEAGVDVVLVGDSVGTNILGYRTPQQVTMADMLHHVRAVRRGVSRAFLLADMPFMSYQVSAEAAVANAGRLVQEGGAEGVKLEGGSAVLPQIEAIVRTGIPVMGHLGFSPQSQSGDLYAFSDARGTVARYQAKGPTGARHLLEQAQRLEQAGVFGIVLEMVTEEAAEAVARHLEVPVIGIGAGRRCDGQVLTVTDVAGWSDQELRFARAWAHWRGDLVSAVQAYCEAVRQGAFPDEVNVVHMQADKAARLRQALADDAPAPADETEG